MGKLRAVFNAHSANHCGNAQANIGSWISQYLAMGGSSRPARRAPPDIDDGGVRIEKWLFAAPTTVDRQQCNHPRVDFSQTAR
jgi:hypothetical protein